MIDDMIIERTEHGIHKKLDLRGLPTRKWGEGKIVDWKKCDNEPVEFQYGSDSGTLFVSYDGISKHCSYVKVMYNGLEKRIRADVFREIRIASFFTKKLPKELHHLIVHEKDKWVNVNQTQILCECPSCGRRGYVTAQNLFYRGFSCELCRESLSRPELATIYFLEFNNIEYKKEYSPEGIKPKRFDFYLPKEKVFVECHGVQHYRASFGEDAFLETTTSDEEKRSFCRAEKAPLIEIDCTNTSANSIVSKLTKELSVTLDREFDFESTVAFVQQQLHLRYATPSNLYIKENYKKGEPIDKIAQALNVSESTIRNRLRDMGIPIKARGRKVVETNHGMVFYSLTEAAIFGGASVNAVYLCCANKQRTAGEHPQTSSPLSWEYYEEYREKSKHKVLIECRIHQEEGNYSA